MIRALVLSDLHLEFWREENSSMFRRAFETQPDIVILAGDISNGGKAVKWAARTFAGIQVIYVMGNHEAYGSSIENTELDIADECAKYPNVKFLNCSEFIFRGVRFLGATLWTDYLLYGPDLRQKAMMESALCINDFNAIRLKAKGYRKFSPTDSAELFSKHKNWLQTKLVDEPFDGKTVVVTHMTPSYASVPERFRDSLVSACFSSNLDKLVEKASFWIHGHTHDSFKYRIGECTVVCNPCGYPLRTSGSPENAAFDPCFILEIDN